MRNCTTQNWIQTYAANCTILVLLQTNFELYKKNKELICVPNKTARFIYLPYIQQYHHRVHLTRTLKKLSNGLTSTCWMWIKAHYLDLHFRVCLLHQYAGVRHTVYDEH
ncbi:hypothetical protein HN011_007184 [Eciton burchellii]|nr:hypothetical protein HN011_007184 [Eciton burchellii]